MPEPDNAPPTATSAAPAVALQEIPRKLAHIQTLWQKLQYVKWDPQVLALVRRLAQEIHTTAHGAKLEELAQHARRLEQQLEVLQSRPSAPPEVDRGQVKGMLQNLARTILASQATDRTLLPAVAEAPRVDPGKSHCVYVLDPNTHEAGLLAHRLSHYGFAVSRFSSSDELHAAMHQRVPDMILADTQLGQRSMLGIDAINAVRAEFGTDIPVVFLSTRSDLAVRLAAVRAGGVGFFTKPLDFQELFRRVDDLLQRQSADYKVLIVEDEEQLASTYSLVLQHAGYTTQVLSRPLQILQVMQQFQPDILLMDLHLPECTGIELMQLIRQEPAYYALPILFLSGENDPVLQNHALSQGADLFLLKPIKPEVLVATVSHRVGRARAIMRLMHFLGQQDPLTGLLNQHAFLGHLERHLGELRGGQRQAVLLYCEVDQSRHLRDRLGITTADLLLADLAAHIKNHLQQASRLAHFAEGSFCALLVDTDPVTARDIANALCNSVATSVFTTGQESVSMTLSVGIAGLDGRYASGQDWLSAVAVVCDLARAAGGNNVRLHHEAETDVAAHEQHQRTADLLRTALANDEYYCLYQPIAGLRGKKVERYDVLLRLRDPQGREISAARILDVARVEGLVPELDRWVVGHVIEKIRTRMDSGSKTVFFIKIAAETLNDPGFMVWLEARLAESAVDPQRFVFEFLESDVSMALRVAGELFGHLHRIGCSVALEHFGESLNALQLLSHLQVDYVKLDAAFVANLVSIQANRDSVRDILRHASMSGVLVIAGFVEDAASLAVLWQCGVHFIQGNFLQEPDTAMNYDFSDALSE